MKKEKQISPVTKRYLWLGTAIVVGLVLIALVLHLAFRMELGSVSDLVSGLGAIIAILGIGWQTTVQTESEDEKRRKDSRPFSISMRYRTDILQANDVYMYGEMFASQALKLSREKSDARIDKVLREMRGHAVGTMRIQLQGDSPIYNVVLRLVNGNLKLSSDPKYKYDDETLFIPILRPGTRYVWLTTGTLVKMGEFTSGTTPKFDTLKPKDLEDAIAGEVSFTTLTREEGTIALKKDAEKTTKLLPEPTVYVDAKQAEKARAKADKHIRYSDSAGYSTRVFQVADEA